MKLKIKDIIILIVFYLILVYLFDDFVSFIFYFLRTVYLLTTFYLVGLGLLDFYRRYLKLKPMIIKTSPDQRFSLRESLWLKLFSLRKGKEFIPDGISSSLSDGVLYFRDLTFRDKSLIILGSLDDGSLLSVSLDSLMHLGIIGSTGYGKSVLLQSVALQILLNQSAKAYIIDVEGVTFPFLYGSSSVTSYASNAKEAVSLLSSIREELDIRLGLLKEGLYTTIKEYNEDGNDPQFPIFVFIEEFLILLSQDASIDKQVADLITQSRKASIYFVIASQVWPANAVSITTRRMLATRVGFHTNDTYQARHLGFGQELVDLEEKGVAYIDTTGFSRQKVRIPFLTNRDLRNYAREFENKPLYQEVPPVSCISDSDIVKKFVSGTSVSALAASRYGTNGGNQSNKIKKLLINEGVY